MKRLLGLSVLVAPVSSFMPKPLGQLNKAATWQLREVIRGEDVDSQPFDIGAGGVRLAEESAIKLTGEVKHKPGKADAAPSELLRYNSMKEVDEKKVNDVFSKVGSAIVCSGQGQELYKDPGDTLEKLTLLGPMEAVKDAVAGATSAIQCERLVFNFLGGDDLMLGEVLDATNEMVIMLDIKTKAKITFNSLCHSSIPAGTCAVTVVSVGKGTEEGTEFSGVDKSIAAGEVYLRDGSYWTVQESEINTAVA